MSDANSDLPQGPEKDERGLVMRADGAEFRTRDQLSTMNRERLSKKGLKPIEVATFDDIRNCNRDHLRTYCSVYNMKKREKAEMELDMARYVAAWHHGQEGYDLGEYKPSSVPATPTIAPRSGLSPIGSRPSRSGSSSAERPALTPPEGVDVALLNSAAPRPQTRTHKRVRLSFSGDPESSTRKAAQAPDSVQHETSADGETAPPASATPAAAVPGATQSPRPQTPQITEKSPSRLPASNQTQPALKTPQAPPLVKNVGANVNVPALSQAPSPVPPQPSQVSPTVVPPKPKPTYPMVQVPAPRVAAAQSLPSQAALAAAARTSFKQYAHARQAAARYKAAYNGAGPAIVQVVENAAAYFEGRNSGESTAEKKRSYERYQFNVDLLSEIFDGPQVQNGSEVSTAQVASQGGEAARAQTTRSLSNGRDRDGDAVMTASPSKPPELGHTQKQTIDSTGPLRASAYSDMTLPNREHRRKALANEVMDRLARRMMSRSDADRGAELLRAEETFKTLVARDEALEKVNIRAFQKLERARTLEDVEKARREFEQENDIRFIEDPSRLIRRTLDKAAPLVQPPVDMRIIKFP